MAKNQKNTDAENGDVEKPERGHLGKWTAGGKGGPGRHKIIHPAPLFEGDDETKLLAGIPPEAIEPKPEEEPAPEADVADDGQEITIPDALRPLLKRDHVTEIYKALARKAAGGRASTSAAAELFKMIDRYKAEAGEAGPVDDAGAYAGLPQIVADLCLELDVGLSELLHRYSLGFVMEPIELVIVQAANAVRRHGPQSRQTSRWAGFAIAGVDAQTMKGPKYDEN